MPRRAVPKTQRADEHVWSSGEDVNSTFTVERSVRSQGDVIIGLSGNIRTESTGSIKEYYPRRGTAVEGSEVYENFPSTQKGSRFSYHEARVRMALLELRALLQSVVDSYQDPFDRQILYHEFKKKAKSLWDSELPGLDYLQMILSYLEDALYFTRSERLREVQINSLIKVVEIARRIDSVTLEDVRTCGRILRSADFETLPEYDEGKETDSE